MEGHREQQIAVGKRDPRLLATVHSFGARPGIAVRAAEVLSERYPGVQIVGVYSTTQSPVVEVDPQIVERIRL